MEAILAACALAFSANGPAQRPSIVTTHSPYQRSKCSALNGCQIVHPSVGHQQCALVALVTQEDTTPVIDQQGDVVTPIHFRNFLEDRAQHLVVDQLAVEGHDQVVDLSPRREIAKVIILRR